MNPDNAAAFLESAYSIANKKLGQRQALIGYVFLVAGVFSIIGFCLVFSEKKPFWNDEINSWMLITDLSWQHMFYALTQAADGSFPLYFVAVRPWAALFGSSEL